jgi:hypothetical protein
MAATIAVVVVVIFGLHELGGPGTQRLVQSDIRTVRTMAELAQRIQLTWAASGRTLPASLEEFPLPMRQNLISKKPFLYHPKSNGEYELCATFATDSRNLQPQNGPDSWAHPKGDYCFQLNAAQPPPQVPYLY